MNHSKLIDDLGGTSKVAELFEVTTGAVSQWREDGIPRARLLHLKSIRPDLFKRETEVESQ
jgi:phage terminase Nu1 subunit (DNA packaging protein)